MTDVTATSSGTVQTAGGDGATSSSAGDTPSSGGSSSTNVLLIAIAGIVGGAVIAAIIAVVVVKRRSFAPGALVLGAGVHDPGNDWANPIYSAPARNVAFDNPIYDRLTVMA